MLCGFNVCSLPGFWPDSLIITVIGSVLVSPYQVYVAPAALSSIYIISSTIYMEQKYISHQKVLDAPQGNARD